MKICPQCQTGFDITPDDQKVYERFHVPAPILCTDCRRQKRLSFRNENNLYQRQCDRCKKSIVTTYFNPKLTVYCNDCWWGDQWDPLSYGRNFDFKRPFFEQFKELLYRAPLLSNNVLNSINCEYNSFCVDSRNCYQSSRIGNCEDIYYSYLPMGSERCMDCFSVSRCQDCYECIDCWDCNHCFYSQLCKNSNDIIFCYDLIGCHDCFGSIGLRNVQYYFFNQKCTRKQYESYLQKYYFESHKNFAAMRQKFYEEERLKKPVRDTIIVNSQNASGNYINESKDIYQGFDMERTDSSRYSWGALYSKDVYDCDFMHYAENAYENISNSKSQNITFTYCAMGNCYDISYSILCLNNTHDCFGCIGLKHQEYCILNKKYSKEDYFNLKSEIINHMRTPVSADGGRSTGEYGQFFPISLSPYAYNETFAQDYFPITREEALKKGWPWKEKDHKEYQKQTYTLPENIRDVRDDILKNTLACHNCSKNYRIIDKELAFYRDKKLMIPTLCPACRHMNRLKLRNPRKLWNRKCDKCQKAIQTTYAPDRPEKVYCEGCYLKEVY